MSDLAPILEAVQVNVRAGERVLLRNASLSLAEGQILGLIGPSGAGKSTLLRSLNRLNDLHPGLRVSGDVRLRGASLYAPSTDVNAMRARIGMLFQQPVIFPASIEENVLFGAKRLRPIKRDAQIALVESALKEAALWEEVRDRLRQPALTLSVGQQQRLCLGRILAVQPEVILMDEPTSALDPRSTEAIEELLLRLKAKIGIVIVTHNIAQARRVADQIACVCVREGAGELVEQGNADAVLCCPQTPEAQNYLLAS